MTQKRLNDLIYIYQTDSDEKVKKTVLNEIIEYHQHLVRLHILQKYYFAKNNPTIYQVLMKSGSVATVTAVKKYDLNSNQTFQEFAEPILSEQLQQTKKALSFMSC